MCGSHNRIVKSLLPVAIVPLYWRDQLQLSMTDIFLLQALFGLAAAIFEFPGGYVADRIGYRKAMLIATGCSGRARCRQEGRGSRWIRLLKVA